jgi:hypothetical protein
MLKFADQSQVWTILYTHSLSIRRKYSSDGSSDKHLRQRLVSHMLPTYETRRVRQAPAGILRHRATQRSFINFRIFSVTERRFNARQIQEPQSLHRHEHIECSRCSSQSTSYNLHQVPCARPWNCTMAPILHLHPELVSPSWVLESMVLLNYRSEFYSIRDYDQQPLINCECL